MIRHHATLGVLCTFLVACLSGCAAVSVIANAVPQTVPAKYSGLAGQSVGVMVWADRGTRIDYPNLQLDAVSAIQNLLLKTQASGAAKTELQNTTFPIEPRSIARYQIDHPEIEAMAVTEFAPNLGVSRLIYIEIEQFATRSQMALDMYRGSLTATLTIVEIAGPGQARIAFQENDIRAIFPPKSKPEGVPVGRDDVMYGGVIRELAAEIVKRLVAHEAE
jgi:hypothetical protein